MAAAQIDSGGADVERIIQLHPELYHYTGADGLKGIIESNSFWATYFPQMNDAQEIHHLRPSLVLEMAARLTPIVEQIRLQKPRDPIVGRPGAPQHVAQRWSSILYDVIFADNESTQATRCYITSFCSHTGDQGYERENGLLSQWRAYGRDGFCLVFDTAALWKLFVKERSLFLYAYTNLLEAYYPRKGGEIFQNLGDLLDASEAPIKSALAGNGDFRVDDSVFLPFLASATAFKHQGFYEEREIRFVALAGTQIAADTMKGVEGFDPKPLKEIIKTPPGQQERHRIALFGIDFPTLPLKRVIVGPSNQQAENAAFAQRVLGSRVPITKSATPFVG